MPFLRNSILIFIQAIKEFYSSIFYSSKPDNPTHSSYVSLAVSPNQIKIKPPPSLPPKTNKKTFEGLLLMSVHLHQSNSSSESCFCKQWEAHYSYSQLLPTPIQLCCNKFHSLRTSSTSQGTYFFTFMSLTLCSQSKHPQKLILCGWQLMVQLHSTDSRWQLFITAGFFFSFHF